MTFKQIAAITSVLLTALTFTACQQNNTEKEESSYETSTGAMVNQAVIENRTEIPTDTETTNSPDISKPETSEPITYTEISPAEWDLKEIVAFYKSAAIKTNPSAKSERNITLTDISVNNGQYENVFEFITPIMSKILARNSTEVDGITGGFTKLSENDIKNAKAYLSGNNTVIEMTMKNQIAGPRENMNEGTVGHAMAVVGDIGVVVDQLKEYGLPMELSDKDTSIHYSDAKLKVTINSDGKIISGTWSYTVDIRMNNYKVFGKDVENTSVVMVNTITLL